MKSRVGDGSPGTQYVFRLEDVGLSERDETEAVQVYKWVEGVDLSRRLAQLPAEFVADVGFKLGQAVQFLHSSNIIHRDISPRNVVLKEDGADPVIIDFGFARRLRGEVKTRFEGECSAPEVRRSNAKWTRAADIYSLGATLRAVIDQPDGSGPVQRVLQACQEDNPDLRPDAATLIGLFQEAAKDLHIENKKAEARQRLFATAGTACLAMSWVRGILEKFEGNFTAVALGCFPDQFDRCREAANFLNQLLEAWPAGRVPDRLSLGRAKDENAISGKKLATEEVRFMHAIRNFTNHGDFRRGGVMSKFPYETNEQMRMAARNAAEQIAKFLELGTLPSVVEFLL